MGWSSKVGTDSGPTGGTQAAADRAWHGYTPACASTNLIFSVKLACSPHSEPSWASVRLQPTVARSNDSKCRSGPTAWGLLLLASEHGSVLALVSVNQRCQHVLPSADSAAAGPPLAAAGPPLLLRTVQYYLATRSSITQHIWRQSCMGATACATSVNYRRREAALSGAQTIQDLDQLQTP